MPITPFLQGQYFDPETVSAMSRAFRAICRKLGLADRNDPLNEVIARQMIELASAGARDARALYKLTMISLKASKPRTV